MHRTCRCEVLTYTQFYHQLEHLGEIQRGHEQTLQNLIYHYVLCQTSQKPATVEQCKDSSIRSSFQIYAKGHLIKNLRFDHRLVHSILITFETLVFTIFWQIISLHSDLKAHLEKVSSLIVFS